MRLALTPTTPPHPETSFPFLLEPHPPTSSLQKRHSVQRMLLTTRKQAARFPQGCASHRAAAGHAAWVGWAQAHCAGLMYNLWMEGAGCRGALPSNLQLANPADVLGSRPTSHTQPPRIPWQRISQQYAQPAVAGTFITTNPHRSHYHNPPATTTTPTARACL